MASISDTLAANLHAVMLERGVTQQQLASRSRIAQSTISLYLNPQRRLQGATGSEPSATIAKVQALADALDVDVWELLSAVSPGQRALVRGTLAMARELTPPIASAAEPPAPPYYAPAAPPRTRSKRKLASSGR